MKLKLSNSNLSVYNAKAKNTNKSYFVGMNGMKLTLNIANLKRKVAGGVRKNAKKTQISMKKRVVPMKTQSKFRMFSPKPTRSNLEFPNININEKMKSRFRKECRSPVHSNLRVRVVKTKASLNKKKTYPRCEARALNQNIDSPSNTPSFGVRRSRAFSHDVILENSSVLSQVKQNEPIRFLDEFIIKEKVNSAKRNKGFVSPGKLWPKAHKIRSITKFTSPRDYANEFSLRRQKECGEVDFITLECRKRSQEEDLIKEDRHHLSNLDFDHNNIAQKYDKSHIQSCDISFR
ncbi:unnamed protein product [Moneuplotes crassus]|uniref:Uncharacterized protein n=1 Tax=Euplotes crassus TaxID=5936 RepID=A0AAD1XIK1_EUPCR|nr:unnamed protein product [Moneuplotes crassus]